MNKLYTNKILKPRTPLQETLDIIESTLQNHPIPAPLTITILADLLGVSYSHIYSAIRRSDRTQIDFTSVLVDGKAQTAAMIVPPSKEEPVKGHPHAELLRLAAEGNKFEVYHVGNKEWRTIAAKRLLIESLKGYTYKWRVAPKVEVITQWERRFFDEQTKLVKSVVSHSKENLNNYLIRPNRNWISEPIQTEYTVKV